MCASRSIAAASAHRGSGRGNGELLGHLQLPAPIGHWFAPDDDRLGSDPVAVIGDGMWGRLFGRSPGMIGQRVRIGTERYRIVGVAPAGFVGMSPPQVVEIWLPLSSQPEVRVPLVNPGEWERPLVRMIGRLADGTTTREAEAGMRAIGAQRADLLWMVLGRGLRLTAMGIALGLLLSAAAARLLGGLLYGLSPLDPVSFGGASVAWTAVAMLASYIPAGRAMQIGPVVALRWE